MKVKTLLKTFINIEYVLQSESRWTLEDGYTSSKYTDGDSIYEDYKVLSIETNPDSGILYITIKA